jgi:hypothetical protein
MIIILFSSLSIKIEIRKPAPKQAILIIIFNRFKNSVGIIKSVDAMTIPIIV